MLRKISAFRRKGSEDRRQSQSEHPDAVARRATSPPQSSSTDSTPEGLYRTLSTATTVKSLASPRRASTSLPESGPLGLGVVYTPNHGHKADIVFVHGLGGTSRWTWSKNKNPELFWPLTFLALEPDLCLARILTFGYNSAFHKPGDGKTSVLDFAENLLHDLKYSEDEDNNSLNIGSVPLIFVAHSMGGLIVKEACIQGTRRPQFESIISSVEALVFLATPHRGAQIAQLLNRILQSVVISNSKQYVNDLLPTSFTLESQAESFRHIANRFKLLSFYETQPTSLGLSKAKVMLLGKETSVLGYPDEISRALDADHHNVCKYDGLQDPNYVIVKNALRALMRSVVQRASGTSSHNQDTVQPQVQPDRGSIETLKTILALQELPSEDLLFYRGQWKAGTCNWILEDKSYLDWARAEEPSSRLLWHSGRAAAGKSVLSSYVVKDLEEQGASVQYFFIRHGQPRKRSLSLLLRSIAYQFAQTSSDFLQKAVALKAEHLDFGTMDPKSIWERLFRSILLRIPQEKPSFWVIDGLDEAENPRTFLELLHEVSSSCPMIRVLVTSRDTPELIAAFEPLAPTSISIGGHGDDLRHFIRAELLCTGSPEIKEKLVGALLDRAEDNFLFVRLVVAELNTLQNRSYEELKQVIDGFQRGMEALYDRMARAIAQSSPQDKAMAAKILQCVNVAGRALTVREMAQILGQQLSHEAHFRASVIGVCAGFLLIEEDHDGGDACLGSKLAMIHQTSREYLVNGGEERPFRVDRRAAHAQMFQSCMSCLMQSADLKAKIRQNQTMEFLEYSATFWSYHLSQTSVGDTKVLETLRTFLTEQKSSREWVLIWIHYLAANNQLRILPQTSKRLSDYAAKLKANGSRQGDNTQQAMQLCELIDNWAIDLIKVAGKFGATLLRNPRFIYKLIPPFCPRGSPIYQQFGQKEAKNLAVCGALASVEKWDDSLARMTFGTRVQSTAVSAAGPQIAVLAPAGKVFMYDSSTFEQTTYSPFDHLERVSHIALTSTGSLLASHGYEMTKIWEVSTGVRIVSAANLDSKPRPHAMMFTDEDKTLLVAFDDRVVRALDLRQSSPAWSDIAMIDEKDLPGHFLNAPSHMALNPGGTRLAIAYRGYPLSAWKLRGDRRPKHSGHCWRRGKSRKQRGEVEDIVWHPRYRLVLGVYSGGVVFKWRLGFKDSTSRRPRWEPKEIAAGASKIAMSPDGRLFATGDPRGAVKIYTTLGFHLLYHLASQDMIGGITFSPDMRRLYDTRGFYASAWEPTALVRWLEQAQLGAASSLDSLSDLSVAHDSAVSVNWTPTLDTLTVIATPASRSSIYCVGTAGGGVCFHHTQRGKLADIRVSENHFGIEKLAMSRDGKYVCFTDTIKTLVVASVDYNDKGSDAVITVLTEISLADSVNGTILDLVFHHDTTHILVQASSSVHTVSLATLALDRSADLDTPDMRWISHPADKTRILGFSTRTVRIYDWNLQPLHSYDLVQDVSPSFDNFDAEFAMARSKVDRLLPFTNGKYILVQASQPSSHASQDKSFFCVDVSLLPSSKTESSKINTDAEIATIAAPAEVSSQIGAALGFVKGNRLIFLSKTFSVCFWQMELSRASQQQQQKPPVIITPDAADLAPDAPTSPDPVDQLPGDRRGSASSVLSSSMVRELFPLPGDWVSYDSLMVSTLWTREKSFLCSKGGEVAIVRSPELRASKD